MPIQGQSLRTFRKDLRELVLYGPTSLGKSWFACVQFTLTLHPIDYQSLFSQPIHCHSQTTQSVQTKPFTNQPILVHSANPMPIQCPTNAHPIPILHQSTADLRSPDWTNLNQSQPIHVNLTNLNLIHCWSSTIQPIHHHSANLLPISPSTAIITHNVCPLNLHAHYSN